MRRRSCLGWIGGAAGAAVAATTGLVSSFSQAQSSHEILRWPEGRPAPELQLPDLDGKVHSLAEFHGQVVVLNFWATWCPPCRAEMPSLQQMAEFYARDGVQVLAVDVGETPQRVSRYLADAGLRLLTLVDGQKAVSRAWGVKVLPSTIVIDRQGQPQHLLRGEVDWIAPEISRLLEPLVRRAAAGSSQA